MQARVGGVLPSDNIEQKSDICAHTGVRQAAWRMLPEVAVVIGEWVCTQAGVPGVRQGKRDSGGQGHGLF